MIEFDYACRDCFHKFTLKSRSVLEHDSLFKVCPICGSNNIYKVFLRVPAVHFKGNGFYKTDTRKE